MKVETIVTLTLTITEYKAISYAVNEFVEMSRDFDLTEREELREELETLSNLNFT